MERLGGRRGRSGEAEYLAGKEGVRRWDHLVCLAPCLVCAMAAGSRGIARSLSAAFVWASRTALHG